MARLDGFFQKMLELEASDLHLTTGLIPYFRLHGEMVPVPNAPIWEAEEMRAILYEITPQENQQQYESENDSDFAYELPGKARFRANIFMDQRGPGAVFRLIPAEILTCEQLGLPAAVKKLCYLSKGLVLVTGPTGSGKSTTLAAMIDLINKTRKDHIITIEDPVEFVHQSNKCLVHQREVGRHTLSFKRALRAALREDPDIILVGEMRDLETIEIAIETAETGHLVFGTLHTTTAVTTIDRIIDQFPAERQAQVRTMLSSSMKGVVAQTLCKRIPTGRVAAIEILLGTPAVGALIREGKTYQLESQIQTGSKAGMRLLNDSLVELVEQGLVDPVEAYMKSVAKEGLVNMLHHIGVEVDLSTIADDPSENPGGMASPSSQASLDGPGAALPSAGEANQQPRPATAGGEVDFESFRRNRGR